MTRYPLEFGWHTDDQSADAPKLPVFTPVMPTLLGGALQRSPADILYGSSPPPDSDPVPDGITPVGSYHYGDLKCTAGDCASGGDWGTTGAYTFRGRIFCRKCMLRELGAEYDSPAEQIKELEKYLLPGS